MKDMLRFGVNMIKDLISALIEGIIGMFVGVFKKILRVIKEGIKIGMQTFSILFGENSRKLTKNEKGDAIIKVLGGSAVAICGIGINMLLEKIPALSEEGRSVISTLLSGLASILLFYALDSADLFNVKEEKRKQRIKEVFEMRIQDVKEKTSILTDSAAEAIRNNYIKSNSLLHDIKASADDDNYLELNKKLEEYSRLLFPMNKRNELN